MLSLMLRIKVGDTVKIVYKNRERFWVLVTSILNDDVMRGIVQNNLVTTNRYKYGDPITFTTGLIRDIWID